MEKTELSIIIPAKNLSQDLENCIKSIMNAVNYKQNENIEIIVATHEKNIYENNSDFYKNIFLVGKGGKYPLNASQARNIGINNAKSELLAFVDSDCIVDLKWVERILINFEKIKDIKKIAVIQGNYWKHIKQGETSWSRLQEEYRTKHSSHHIKEKENYSIIERLDGRNFAIYKKKQKNLCLMKDYLQNKIENLDQE